MAEGQITDPKVKECIDLIKKAYDIYRKDLDEKQKELVKWHMDQITEPEEKEINLDEKQIRGDIPCQNNN